MTVPKGWQEWDPCGGDKNRPVECGHCQWEGFENDIPDGIWGIDNIYDRIDPGSVVPVGPCPAKLTDSNIGTHTCQSHTYFSDVEIVYRLKPTVLDKIVEAID